MILVDRHMVRVSGKVNTLLSDFAILVNSLRESGIRDEDLKEAFKVGFMSKEELKNVIKEKQEEVEMKLQTFFDEFFPDGRAGL